MPGKRYGNVRFDAFREISWDFKAHAVNTGNHKIIVNDSEATANAIEDHGEVGLILALGAWSLSRTFELSTVQAVQEDKVQRLERHVDKLQVHIENMMKSDEEIIEQHKKLFEALEEGTSTSSGSYNY